MPQHFTGSWSFQHLKTGWRLQVTLRTGADAVQFNQLILEMLKAFQDEPVKAQGNVIRALAAAGYILEPQLRIRDVDDLPAAQIRWMNRKINQITNELIDEVQTFTKGLENNV